jgi:hypothetical protein
MEAGTFRPFARCRSICSSASASPSPMAVPACGSRSARARSIRPWSRERGATTVAKSLKATTPTRRLSGRDRTKSRAAAFAAVMRSGRRSVAAMDRLTSTTSMIDACSRGTLAAMEGRATAPMSRMKATRKMAGGTWRRHRGWRGTTAASSSRLVKRTV